MIVRRLTPRLKYSYKRGCKHKKERFFISAVLASIRLQFKGIIVRPYKCLHGNHYHIGHINKNPKRKLTNSAKLTLLYKD